MEILVVVGTLLVCFALGVPIAYALGLGALAGAYWIGIPLEAVMLQVSSGVSKFAMLTIPFFVLAGAVVREIWPFYGVMFFVLMLVTYIPSVSLWLPRMLGL